jgi:V8-like Glu-specific endopeptidase
MRLCKVALICSAGLIGMVAVVAVAYAQVYREGLVQAIEPVVANTFRDRGDGVLWEGRVGIPGSTYVRLYFSEITSPPGAEYVVVVRAGPADKAIARYPAAVFAQSSGLYTEVLFGDVVKVQVEGQQPLSGLSFKIDRFVRQVDLIGRMSPQSVVASWYSIADLNPGDPARQLAQSIAKLYIGDGWVCSGFLISPNVLLTNFHCLKDSNAYLATAQQRKPSCSDIEMQFDFDREPASSASVRAQCLEVLDADEGLDYAALELDPSAITVGGLPRGYLRLAKQAPSSRSAAVVIHHPAGLAKKLSFCSAFATNEVGLLEHDCSTTGGSSGAPVLATDGSVIGLHFAGAFAESMTVREINDAIAEGKVFRNKSKSVDILRERLKQIIPR